MWTVGGGHCGQRQWAFVPDQSWPHWQTNLWLGGVSVSVLSVGATERNSREEEKRASKNGGEGVLKEKTLACKKFVRHPETHEKDSGHFSACWPQSFLCGILLLAAAGRTLMRTQTGQKERPSAVYSTVVSVSHGGGH